MTMALSRSSRASMALAASEGVLSTAFRASFVLSALRQHFLYFLPEDVSTEHQT